MKCVLLAALIASTLSLPTDTVPRGSDPKPMPAAPAAPAGDDYDVMHSDWHEPKADKTKDFVPQTGSLIGIKAIDLVNVPVDIMPKNPLDIPPPPPAAGSAKISDAKPSDVGSAAPADHPNPSYQYYPIERTQTERAFKESTEKVAKPLQIDPANKDANGVPSGTVVFDRPEAPHPMEAKTPLTDDMPCDPQRVLKVNIPAAYMIGTLPSGEKVPVLPLRYGCSSAKDVSREKISPEISWNNVSSDVFEFSMQMISLGEFCEQKSPDYGQILWHVTGIKGADQITLKEGASHDSRMLFGGREQPNQYLEEYYSGPCPTPGTAACYRFKVLAHRANGWCQCGFQDVLFLRPEQLPPPMWYTNTTATAENSTISA